MTRAFIRLGDRTTHGGTVVSADYTWTIDGKPVARIGDFVVCRKCRGTFAIASGAEDMTSFGQPVARHGDKTACGATLLSSQATAWWDAPSGGAGVTETPPKAAAEQATSDVAAVVPTICLECLVEAASAGAATVVRG